MQFLGKQLKLYGEPFVVAELSCNHGGDKEKIHKLIEEAKHAGANAVKIQAYTPDCLTSDNIKYKVNGTQWQGRNLYELYKKTHTPFEWLADIFDIARFHDIPCFSSVFSERGLAELEKVNCPAYKIASAEANHILLIQEVMKTNKPLIVSTGMADVVDIQRLKWSNYHSLIVMHCVSEYPVKSGHENVQRVYSLGNNFKTVGYSDHSLSAYSAQYAYAAGACIFEKHFTVDYGTEDEKFSLTPPAFKLYVKYLKNAAKCFQPTNVDETFQFKRSIYAVAPIKKGARITEFNTAALRPFLGITAGEYPNVLTKRAVRNIKPGEPIKYEDIK